VPKLVSILDFAYRIGFTNLCDWQARILLRYEGGEPTAAACATDRVDNIAGSFDFRRFFRFE
jgi:hypothetical protein